MNEWMNENKHLLLALFWDKAENYNILGKYLTIQNVYMITNIKQNVI